jgi:hypothetical protein
LTNLPPVADAGPDQTVSDVNGDGSESVTLNGSASTDQDGTITTYAWREAGASIAAGPTPTVWLAVGTHTITLEVTDEGGATASDTVVVNVERANRVTVTAPLSQAYRGGPCQRHLHDQPTGDTSAPLTVRYTVGGTAASGTDYAAIPARNDCRRLRIGDRYGDAHRRCLAVEKQRDRRADALADAATVLDRPVRRSLTIVSDDLPPDLDRVVSHRPRARVGGRRCRRGRHDREQGDGTTQASRTGFYLSVNTFLDASDLFLGNRSVPVLAPSAVDTQSTTLHVPPSVAAGSYYIIAKADYLDAGD